MNLIHALQQNTKCSTQLIKNLMTEVQLLASAGTAFILARIEFISLISYDISDGLRVYGSVI
jgi:hypothetical protein